MDSSKKLQLFYYNMITDLFGRQLWDETIINHILQKICAYIEADDLALYVHVEKSEFLHLLGALSSDMPETLAIKEDMLAQDIFGAAKPEHNQLLSIQPEGMQNMVLVYNKEGKMSDSFMLDVKNETEKLLKVVIRTWRNLFRNKNNQFLQQLSAKLLKAHDKKDVLQEIVRGLECVYHNGDYKIILTQEYDDTTNLPVMVMEYKDEEELPVSTQVIMSGELQVETVKEQLQKIYAPLIGEQSVYGVLEITIPIVNSVLKEEVEFIKEFAVLSGKALEKTILYEDSLLQVSNLTLINEFNHELNSTRVLAELTELIRSQIIRITGASEAGFIYFNEESGEADILDGGTTFFQTVDGQRAADIYREKILAAPTAIFSGKADDLQPFGFQSAMILPMVHSGLNMGFSMILHEEAYRFTFENFKLTESLMQHSALAISNTILREKLQQTVITDFLTQLNTRRYLEDKIQEHLDTGTEGVLLLFDIDDFKLVNDTYGHHVGDIVLKQVSRVMKKTIGNKGIAARWGGEELAIYLPEMTDELGLGYANEIRMKIPEVTEPSVTISCGLTNWKKEDEVTMESLFIQADEALYDAKSSGKDRVLTH